MRHFDRVNIHPEEDERHETRYVPCAPKGVSFNPTNASKVNYCDGGGAFFCILLVLAIMVVLLVQLLVWRIFEVDWLPVDNSITNYDLSTSNNHQGRSNN
jgi:hypothetical protein